MSYVCHAIHLCHVVKSVHVHFRAPLKRDEKLRDLDNQVLVLQNQTLSNFVNKVGRGIYAKSWWKLIFIAVLISSFVLFKPRRNFTGPIIGKD